MEDQFVCPVWLASQEPWTWSWLAESSMLRKHFRSVWSTGFVNLEQVPNLLPVAVHELPDIQFVVYFEQILGAVRTQKLVEILFFSRFQPFLFFLNIVQWISVWNHWKTYYCIQSCSTKSKSKRKIKKLKVSCNIDFTKYTLQSEDLKNLIPRPGSPGL